jgi:hypothetical protein
MYAVLIILLLGCTLFLVARWFAKQNWNWVIAGICFAVFTGLFLTFLSFWGEAIWFQSTGYEHRFWNVVLTKVILAIIGALFGILVMTAFTWQIPKTKRALTLSAKVLGAYIASRWVVVNWDKTLLFLNRVTAIVSDPGTDCGGCRINSKKEQINARKGRCYNHRSW